MKPRQRATRREAPLVALVDRLGSSGDGIATLPDGRSLYLAGVLPGESVLAEAAARRGDGFEGIVLERQSSSPDRTQPPCPRFGTCGGCALQHLSEARYLAWKQGLLADALARAGAADVAIAPLRPAAPAERRRADFALRRQGRSLEVGFHAARSTTIVPIEPCLVLDPALVRLARDLAIGLAPTGLPRRDGEAIANLTDTGIDLLIRGDGELDLRAREALAGFAQTADLARLSWAGKGREPEPLVQRRNIRLAFADVAVEPPPGAFLQASRAGEAAIVEAMLAALAPLPDRARVLELHAGIGTLSFPLARHFRVTAMEGDAASVAALADAARSARIPLVTERRDLVRRPPLPAELGAAQAVVLDPPRAGAAEVARALAGSRGPDRVVYVSCAPMTLARDARLLAEGGFRLVSAVPVDQFLWSPHLEVVACLVR